MAQSRKVRLELSSRKSVTEDGHVPDDEFDTVKDLFGAKVLVGKKKGIHNLPDFSHSPNRIYIREDRFGNFREMRIYDEKKRPVLEIAYHPEERISGSKTKPVLHKHTFGPKLEHNPAEVLDEVNYQKYKKYWEFYGI